MEQVLFTVGHSNHELPQFVALLRQHGVTAVADVRSSPYSAYNPQFNRETLHAHLAAADIGYVFLGAELGARRSEPECYDDDGRVCYGRVAQAPGFRAGLQRLADLRRTQRVALMCAEKDPLTCHRTILICRALRESGSPRARGTSSSPRARGTSSSPRARGTESLDIRHIREDGSIETHGAAESRLLALCKLPERDLFHTRDELVADAYDQQASRIAYVANEREGVGAL